MTLKKVLLAVAVLGGAVILSSCKDDDETATNVYLDGTLKFSLEPYLLPDETVTLVGDGVTHPEGGEISYSWVVTPGGASTDSCQTQTFVHNFGTDLKTYTVRLTASATDYTGSSASRTTTVVKPGLDGTGSLTSASGGSIVDLDAFSTFYDSRDGKTYYYTTYEVEDGSYDWFIQNLAYRGTESRSVGVPFAEADALADVFGMFYSWDEAVSACPEGWRLPTAEEWDACLPASSGDLMADYYFNGEKMWEFWPHIEITNSSRFSALPVGQVNLGEMTFTDIQEMAVFWTGTESENEGRAVAKYFVDDNSAVYEGHMDKASFGAPVRCIRVR